MMSKVRKMMIFMADVCGVIHIHAVLSNFEFVFQEFDSILQMRLFSRSCLETSFIGKVLYKLIDLSICIANVLLSDFQFTDIQRVDCTAKHTACDSKGVIMLCNGARVAVGLDER